MPIYAELHEAINKSGPLTVADYMSICLTHPEYGYYVTRDPLGAEGDFITAPEMSQVFGELIGLWLVDMWQKLGSPTEFSVCEPGPGRGTLMADALRAAALRPDFIKGMQLHLLDSSPVLRAKQAEKLGAYHPKWISDFAELPTIPTLFVANEFFDALPVRQFVRVNSAWRERRVAHDKEGNLTFVLMETPDLPTFEAPDDTIVETSQIAVDFANNIARRVVHSRGAALIIDYGDDEIIGETLQAVRHHRKADILASAGLADITAHVSFEPLRTAVRKIGTKTYGLTDMADFLESLGIRQRTAALLDKAAPEQKRSLEAATHRLLDRTDASSMGRLFKAFAFTDRNCPPPSGF